MQMIDVLKRLAELDSKNPTIVKESQQVEECGIMPEMELGGMQERPSMPASINMTAGSGEELSDMLATIMQLAGVKQHGAEEPMGDEPAIALTAEPEIGGDATSDMRSMMDKLNPMDGDDQGSEHGDDGVSAAHGDIDNDGDHDMDDHEAEKDEEETDEGQYDNSPSDPTKPPPFKANQFAHQENQPGQGDRMDGNMPKATMEQQLMAAYKEFVSEGSKKVSEISDQLAKNAYDGRADNTKAALQYAATKAPGLDSIPADQAHDIASKKQARNGRMQVKRDARRAASGVSEDKPSAGMSKGEKSSLVKKAKSGGDIGKPGKSFDKVAKAAGGGEKGKKIAAAAMWKNAAK